MKNVMTREYAVLIARPRTAPTALVGAGLSAAWSTSG